MHTNYVINPTIRCSSVANVSLQIFNPVNYLRNVGIEQVVTPYTLVMDVDLVPNEGLYSEIRKRIPKDMKEPGTVSMCNLAQREKG